MSETKRGIWLTRDVAGNVALVIASTEGEKQYPVPGNPVRMVFDGKMVRIEEADGVVLIEKPIPASLEVAIAVMVNAGRT